MTTKTIGEKIKNAVRKTGMTNQEFCKKVGIGESVISRWLKGNRNPSIKSLKKIAEATNTPLEFFIDDGQKNFIENSGMIGAIGNNNSVNMEEKIKDHEIRILQLEKEILKLKIKK